MIGAIIGDIVGSRFEFNNCRNKNFQLFNAKCSLTDDSYMSLAVAEAILKSEKNTDSFSNECVKSMQEIGRRYPFCGFGGNFRRWIFSDTPRPYGSFGNGAAMRVSPCGFAAESMEEAKQLAHVSASVSHNHEESYKAAEAVAIAIFMARQGCDMAEIRALIEDEYYSIDFTLDEIRPSYDFDVSCQGSVPQAFEAFFESTGFEDAIRNAVSIGGDSDTIAAITGGIAEAYYGVPDELRQKAISYINDKHLENILHRFEEKYPAKMYK